MDRPTLIRAAQGGDLEAFNRLALLYQDFLFRVALNILHDEDAAADAVQQAFLSAFRSLRTFRSGSLRSWLSRIVVNASYDGLRRTARSGRCRWGNFQPGMTRKWSRSPGWPTQAIAGNAGRNQPAGRRHPIQPAQTTRALPPGPVARGH